MSNVAKVSMMSQFDRVLGMPLETNLIHTSLESAETYARTSGQAYSGQLLRVINSGKATLYIIQPDKSLMRLGQSEQYFEKIDIANRLPNPAEMVISHNFNRVPQALFVVKGTNSYAQVLTEVVDDTQVKIIWDGTPGTIYLI